MGHYDLYARVGSIRESTARVFACAGATNMASLTALTGRQHAGSGTGFENWEQNPPPVPGQFLPRFWLRFLLFAGQFPGRFLVDFQKPIVKIGFENWF